MKEESQQLQRFDLELDAIFISVFLIKPRGKLRMRICVLGTWKG